MSESCTPGDTALLFVSGHRTWCATLRLMLRALPCNPQFASTAAHAVALARDADYARLFVDARLAGWRSLVAALDARRYAERVVLLAQTHGAAPAVVAPHGAVRAIHPRPATPAALLALVRGELPSAQAPPLLDAALVAELRATAPAALRATLVARFAREVRALWRAAETARDTGDEATFHAALHRLRGAAASVGACRLEAALAGYADSPPGVRGQRGSDCRALVEASVVALRAALDGG